MKTFPAVAIVSALFACSNTQEPADKEPSPKDQVEAAAPNDTSAPTETTSATQKKNEAVPSPSPATVEMTSEYTSLKNAKCVTVDLDEEAAGYIREQCGDHDGVPLFCVEGDLRQSAYAGNQPSGQTTISPFNYLTDIVEWRIQGNQPIALIYRLKADAQDMSGNGKTQLFVQKIGTNQTKSCIIGIIAGNYPNANETARAVADTAGDITCNNSQTPKTFGDIM